MQSGRYGHLDCCDGRDGLKCRAWATQAPWIRSNQGVAQAGTYIAGAHAHGGGRFADAAGPIVKANDRAPPF
jgi:hypothetical protein